MSLLAVPVVDHCHSLPSLPRLPIVAGYRDMIEFIDTVTDPDRADRLGIAIPGRGAFHRLKDTLAP